MTSCLYHLKTKLQIIGVITFTIAQDKIKPALDQAFNKIKKDLNAPGFRKGQMPRAVFNQKYGEEALYEDALNAILPEVMTRRDLRHRCCL